jgi:hypothetical protein
LIFLFCLDFGSYGVASSSSADVVSSLRVSWVISMME